MRLPFQRSSTAAAAFAPTPAEFPAIDGAEISGMVHGARIGGDFYHFTRTTPRRVVFGLLDVAGQRSENQSIIAAAREAFQSLACAKFSDEEVNEADAMMEFCMELNAAIRRSASAVCVCAAFVGCYNEDLGTICYVNAGHTPGLLRHGDEVSELRATGLPLGLFSASTYEAPIVAVAPGSSLLLVSRGVVEALRKKEEFGLHRVKKHFATVELDHATAVAVSVLDAVRQHLGNAPAGNDLTTLALVRSARG
jgi:sigma-B regulation protein RsbU (phosphoserine phosphatase)